MNIVYTICGFVLAFIVISVLNDVNKKLGMLLWMLGYDEEEE